MKVIEQPIAGTILAVEGDCASFGHDATLAARVRARRIELNYTLAQVASLASCTKSYLSAIENGARSAPSALVLARIETSLQLPAGLLIELSRWEQAVRLSGPRISRELALLARARKEADRLHTLAATARIDASACARFLEILKEITGNTRGTQQAPDHAQSVRWPAFPARYAMDGCALVLQSDHMTPLYMPGDVLEFGDCSSPANGVDSVVVLKQSRDAVFARLYLESDRRCRPCVRLQPHNLLYAPRVLLLSSVQQSHPLVAYKRRISPACEESSAQKGRQQPLSPKAAVTA
jgi:transcriptional regulator with XRE-family HTH domain